MTPGAYWKSWLALAGALAVLIVAAVFHVGGDVLAGAAVTGVVSSLAVLVGPKNAPKEK